MSIVKIDPDIAVPLVLLDPDESSVARHLEMATVQIAELDGRARRLQSVDRLNSLREHNAASFRYNHCIQLTALSTSRKLLLGYARLCQSRLDTISSYGVDTVIVEL